MATATKKASVEKRLTAVEHTVAVILKHMRKDGPAPGWLKRFRGCMADEPGFADLVRYGREFRNADRPMDDDEPS